MHNKKIVAAIILILVAAGSFFGGLAYARQSIAKGGQNFANLSPEQRQSRMGQFGQRQGRMGQGFIGGEILAKDDKSVTVKLKDGGSKIIFFSDSTKVSKEDEAQLTDLAVGEQITTSGTPNSDGSITAQTIQIRPATAPTNTTK